MSGSRLVRGTRSRLFLYVGVVVVVGLAVYVFHGAQLQLDDARKAADKCQQQQESLSAQLQVIFEYKLRLEKSLQQEKTEHRQTREELEAQAAEEKARRDKESLEASTKHAALAQHYKLLQSQHEDLSEDCKKIRVEQLHGLEERGKLEAQLQQVQASHKKSLSSLKSEYLKLEVENEKLQKQHEELLKGTSHTSDRISYLEKQNLQLQRELDKAQKELDNYKMQRLPRTGETKQHNDDETLKSPEKAAPSPSSPSSVSSAAPDAGLNPDNQNVLQEPVVNQDDNLENKVAAQRTTTPQINPQAVLSQDRGQQNNVAPVPPPRQEEKQDAAPNLPRPVVMEPANSWQHGNLPAGVVPAPHGYGAFHQNPQDAAMNRKEEQNAAWALPRFRHVPQPIEPRMRERDNPLDDNGPEEEEEEDDPAHPHRSAQGEQQEIPRQLQNSYNQYNVADIQMEEGEEEAEDDDVDQVDYGNEAGGEGARHHKAGGAQPVVKKQHDSVMVNPK